MKSIEISRPLTVFRVEYKDSETEYKVSKFHSSLPNMVKGINEFLSKGSVTITSFNGKKPWEI